MGPHVRIDHDISLLVPEIWCRLAPRERDPRHLIAAGHLEPLADFEHKGEKILQSRLGYRITSKFVSTLTQRPTIGRGLPSKNPYIQSGGAPPHSKRGTEPVHHGARFPVAGVPAGTGASSEPPVEGTGGTRPDGELVASGQTGTGKAAGGAVAGLGTGPDNAPALPSPHPS